MELIQLSNYRLKGGGNKKKDNVMLLTTTSTTNLLRGALLARPSHAEG